MNTQDERKAFEERFQHLDLDFVEDVGYCESETQYAWAAWWEATKRAQEKLEGCVVVPVDDILNLKRRIEHRYTNANEAINAEGWNPTISGHLDALDWAEQDVSEYLGKYVADVEAARGGNE